MDGISRVFCCGMFYNGYGTLSLASGDTISLKSDILFIYRSAAKSQVSLGCTVGRAANNCTTCKGWYGDFEKSNTCKID